MQLCIVLLCFVSSVVSYNNGYAKKPPLGWQSWCSVGKCGTDHCFDQQIRDTAKAMSVSGMQKLGYEWVVLDDCWHPTRAENGTLVPFPDFFPYGMKPVIDYVHSLGLKFGLYTSVGTKTCHGGWSPGSYGHFTVDAQTFADWEVDYVKVDWCGENCTEQGHKDLSAALNKTGRHMIMELCRGKYSSQDKWGYAPEIAQVWRAHGDHHDNFDSTLSQVQAFKGKSSWSGSYGWAYGDMMMIGGEGCKNYDPMKPEHCPKQTDNEYRTEMSLYSVLSSPMMIGTDIRNMTPIMNECIFNKEVLAINQDYMAVPGKQVMSCNTTAWLRKLSNGNFAVAIPNLSDKSAKISVCLADIGWPSDRAHVRDVWLKKDTDITTMYTTVVDVHNTVLVVLSPVQDSL